MYGCFTCIGKSHIWVNKWSHKTGIRHFFALQACIKTFIKRKITSISVDKGLANILSSVLCAITKFGAPVVVKKSPDKKFMADACDVVFVYTKTHLSRAVHAI